MLERVAGALVWHLLTIESWGSALACPHCNPGHLTSLYFQPQRILASFPDEKVVANVVTLLTSPEV